MLAILLLAQTLPATPPPAPDIVDPADAEHFDLARYKPRAGSCSDTLPSGNDVLVCARMADMPKSLAEQAATFEPKPFRPAWKMLGGEAGVAVEQRATLSGSAPAAMATFKLRF